MTSTPRHAADQSGNMITLPAAIFDKVQSIVAAQLNIDEARITLATTWADLDADSMAQIDILMDLEEQFGFEFAVEDAERFKTVGDAVSILEKHAA